MKKSSILFKTFVLIICSLSLCSCLSINRNIKLNKDGSGREKIRITFLKEFYGMMSTMTSFMDSTRKQGYLDSLYSDEIFINKTRSDYDSSVGIKIINISSEKNPDSSNTFVIEYDFDSIKRISSSLSSLKDDNDNNETVVTWQKEGDNVLFNYKYEEASPEGLSADDTMTVQMKKGMSEMFGSGSMQFEIEFPYEVISSNAFSSERNILVWEFPMSEIFSTGKMNLEAVMKEN